MRCEASPPPAEVPEVLVKDINSHTQLVDPAKRLGSATTVCLSEENVKDFMVLVLERFAPYCLKQDNKKKKRVLCLLNNIAEFYAQNIVCSFQISISQDENVLTKSVHRYRSMQKYFYTTFGLKKQRYL